MLGGDGTTLRDEGKEQREEGQPRHDKEHARRPALAHGSTALLFGIERGLFQFASLASDLFLPLTLALGNGCVTRRLAGIKKRHRLAEVGVARPGGIRARLLAPVERDLKSRVLQQSLPAFAMQDSGFSQTAVDAR